MLPIEGLREFSLGYINVLTDGDSVTRAINNDLSNEYDSFATEIYKKSFGKEPLKKQRLLINYVGGPESFKTYPITDVINNRTPKDRKSVV